MNERVKRGCIFAFLLLFIAPLAAEFAAVLMSRSFGPDLEAYCKDEELFKVFDAALYERRRQELKTTGADVSYGWNTVISEREADRFIYSYVKIQSTLLKYKENIVAELDGPVIKVENIFTKIGLWPVESYKTCEEYNDLVSKHRPIFLPFNDSRFPDPMWVTAEEYGKLKGVENE